MAESIPGQPSWHSESMSVDPGSEWRIAADHISIVERQPAEAALGS